MDDVLAKIHAWAALAEPAMRTAAVAEALSTSMGDARSASVLEAVVAGATRAEAAATSVYQGMVDPGHLAAALGPARLQALYETAEAQNLQLALLWLYASLTALKPPPRGDIDDVSHLVHRELRALTLGDRRALARRSRGEAIKRLVCDPDPGVVHNLLNNPHATESLVLAVCARRPTVAAPLVCVARHPRWNVKYVVRLALARNPHMPLCWALTLLPILRRTDLRTLAPDGTLSETLRLAAQRLCQVE